MNRCRTFCCIYTLFINSSYSLNWVYSLSWVWALNAPNLYPPYPQVCPTGILVTFFPPPVPTYRKPCLNSFLNFKDRELQGWGRGCLGRRKALQKAGPSQESSQGKKQNGDEKCVFHNRSVFSFTSEMKQTNKIAAAVLLTEESAKALSDLPLVPRIIPLAANESSFQKVTETLKDAGRGDSGRPGSG